MATQPEVPLTEAAQAALRDAVLSYLGIMPFEPGALISRSLWLIFHMPMGSPDPGDRADQGRARPARP